MLRSNINTEKSDFHKVKEEIHSNQVWKIIEKNIPIYFERMLERDNGFEELKESSPFSIQSSSLDIRKQLSDIFEKGLYNYQKEEGKYKNFFSEESMHEFEDEDDPKGFKSALSTKVPVILKARNSKREMMYDWQEKFAFSKASDVYSIFFNLIDFLNYYVAKTDEVDFANFNEINELEELFILNEDDDYNVPGVIGMGIKSTILFYLNAKYFLGANKNTLYGFYFLSECENFRLPSGSNEFIMINDMRSESNRRNNVNMLIDQNYWYPYDLITMYGLRAYRKLKDLCANYKYPLDDIHRFVHVNTFMAEIWKMELENIKTMTGGDQEDAR